MLVEKSLDANPGVIERRKILITGCSSGIGYYAAKKLHGDGHIVVAACRSEIDVARLIAEGLHAVRIDLDCSQSIDEGIRDTLTITNGDLDVLVNNAAYGQPGAVEDLSRKALEEQFSTNVFGTHELTVKLMKILLASSRPRIIQISSVLGLVAMSYRGAYISSKFALEGLTDTLRLELADTKVKVSLVEPGPIVSNFRKNAQAAFFKNIQVERSRHIDSYKASISRFGSDKKQPFTLSEDAVYQVIAKAIKSNNPRPRYYVTKPTYIFGFLRRLLSSPLLDKVLLAVSDGEKKRFNDK
ncbi:MAG: SDR family NAD(P)-dependent oxidoreductase [Gammaproteobacteria bacterium]|nr:SDR family NAD(P)-dependent oxidoreductase [Gammaproteobacteria bacterium]